MPPYFLKCTILFRIHAYISPERMPKIRKSDKISRFYVSLRRHAMILAWPFRIPETGLFFGKLTVTIRFCSGFNKSQYLHSNSFLLYPNFSVNATKTSILRIHEESTCFLPLLGFEHSCIHEIEVFRCIKNAVA